MDDEQMLPETAAREVTPVTSEMQIDVGAINRAIDAWFVEHFHNSITSRDTEVFNHCQRAKDDLKRRLAAL